MVTVIEYNTTMLMYELWVSYRKGSVLWLTPGVHSHQHETSAATDQWYGTHRIHSYDMVYTAL